MTDHWRLTGTSAVLVGLAGEIALFSALAPQFATAANFFEVIRFSVELGLLAVALTPVIVSGGIDLSVGSMMGLSAVVFGALAQDLHVPLPLAVLAVLLVGAAGGALNGVLIARLNIPPLIVTLGTFSLFRGLAEGLTHAAVNYTGFPAGFLTLGQGYLWGVVPAQLPILAAATIAFALLLHRSVIGRAWYAIGVSAAGARYSGLAVARRVTLAYVLCGVMASLAAIVYIAHLGQARSDAGTGFELDAITAVVLGGAAVFGGRGSVWGTLAGLFALAVLRNGLQLAALPSELAGVLTGVLLVGTMALQREFRILNSEFRIRQDLSRGVHREEQSGRGAVRHDHRRRDHCVGHECLAGAIAGSTGPVHFHAGAARGSALGPGP